MIDESIRRLHRARELVSLGRDDEAVELLEGLEELWSPERTVTTTEAAHFLGIRSINTLKALLKAEGIQTTQNGSRIMVPMNELLNLKNSRRVQRVQASDVAHEATFDDETPMSQAEMDILHDTRPGVLPWQRK